MAPWRGCSEHALSRARERGISLEAVAATVRHGTRRRTGECASLTLDEAAVRRARAYGLDLARWLWTEAIVSADGLVVTVYRLGGKQRRGRAHREASRTARQADEDERAPMCIGPD